MHTVIGNSQVLAIKSASHQHALLKEHEAKQIKRKLPLKNGQKVLNLMHPEDRKLQASTPLPVSAFVVSDWAISVHPYAKNNQIIKLPKPRRMTPKQMLEAAQAAGHTRQAQVVAAVAR
ncbi:MAG: hypothetical protein FWD27_00535 [Coriobacteriia bacterium]|nr:hypothetical protein [Coriobacteriia bacterium]